MIASIWLTILKHLIPCLSQEQLQQIFYDFANKHRRQKLIDRISSNAVPEMDKVDDILKLFAINYFKDENYNETGKKFNSEKNTSESFFVDSKLRWTVEERIERVTIEAKRDMQTMMSSMQKLIRKNEIKRAREAGLVLSHKLKVISLHRNIINLVISLWCAEWRTDSDAAEHRAELAAEEQHSRRGAPDAADRGPHLQEQVAQGTQERVHLCPFSGRSCSSVRRTLVGVG